MIFTLDSIYTAFFTYLTLIHPPKIQKHYSKRPTKKKKNIYACISLPQIQNKPRYYETHNHTIHKPNTRHRTSAKTQMYLALDTST